MNRYTQKQIDYAAIGVSILCIAHCILLPLLLVLIPTLGLAFLADETIHQYLVGVALIVSGIALGAGCKRHRSLPILAMGVAGLSCLLFASIFGHDLLGEFMEGVMTVVGSALLIMCHIRNYRLCERVGCT